MILTSKIWKCKIYAVIFAQLFNNIVKLMSKKEIIIPDKNTEERILDAARKVFTRKGFAAARMEDIAKEADMNRALLHYYFRSKQKMFEVIFEENLKHFFGNFLKILTTEEELEIKIRKLVEAEIDMLLQNQYLPLFMLNEMNRNPEMIKDRLFQIPQKQFIPEFIKQVEKEITKGTIKKVAPMHLLINIISLCIFPFAGKPMMMTITGIDQKQFELMMLDRKKIIADLIITSIKK